MNRPAWLIDIPSEEYHAATKRGEYLTSHQLAVFRRCPAEYRKRLDGEIIDKDTSTFALGRATHSWVLEGKAAFDLEFVVSDGPINPKTGKPFGRMTKEFAKWREGVESGAFTVDGVPVAEDMKVKKNIVSVEEFALIEAMRKAVGMHPVAWELVSEGFAEGTVRTEWDGEPVQCRMD